LLPARLNFWKHKVTGEKVKKTTSYVCGRMTRICRIERDIWDWLLEKE
jgi:hypothetical protein